MNRKLNVIVCGTRFGQFYIEAMKHSEEFELIGILSRGSQRSEKCTETYGVKMYGDINDLPDTVDLACIVVPTSVMGGEGTNLAVKLMERGVHVLMEQPVHYQDLAECYRIAKRHNVRFTVGNLYLNLPAIKSFVQSAKYIMEREVPLYLNIDMATQVSFPLAHILVELFGNVQPWSIDHVINDDTPFQVMTLTMKGIPVTIRAQNQVESRISDSYMHLMHQMTLGFNSGRLILTDTHGPVNWAPRMIVPNALMIPYDLSDDESLEMTSCVYDTLISYENMNYKEILTEVWPSAILSDIRRGVLNTQSLSMMKEGQKVMQASQLWRDIMGAFGYPYPVTRTNQPFLNIQLIKEGLNIETVSEERECEVTAEKVRMSVASFDEVCLQTILYTFQKQGVLKDYTRSYSINEIIASLVVLPDYHFIIYRWIKELVKQGFLIESEDKRYVLHYKVLDNEEIEHSWQAIRHLWSDQLVPKNIIDYFYNHAIALDELLSGKETARNLLFQSGESDLALSLYKETLIARYLNEQVANKIINYVKGNDNVSILEVGAGTGATTDCIIKKLEKEEAEHRLNSYIFSDISSYFITHAHEKYWNKQWMNYDVLNIEQTADILSIGEASQDIIIAAGVLNNVEHTEEVLVQLATRLKENGMLIITEADGESLQMLISQVFMMKPATDLRSQSDTTFLSMSQWFKVFRAAGLRCQTILPTRDHKLYPLGQRLFALEKDIQRGAE